MQRTVLIGAITFMLGAGCAPVTAAAKQPATSEPAVADRLTVTAADTARFLAGMQPSPGSPLAALTETPAWRSHAKSFDGQWAKLEARQLAKVRKFSAEHVTDPQKTLFYMFSGPDFLYADAFFPNATTLVLSGLEEVGPVPDVAQIPRKRLGGSLGSLTQSLHDILGFGFFKTRKMSEQLDQGRLRGTLPILYLFLARSGKTIRTVRLMRLSPEGVLTEAAEGAEADARAVRITFAGGDGTERTLHYFSTDLSNKGVAASGFLKFCEKLGVGDSFVKSASYLPHEDGFSLVRDFILANSRHVLQDDTGPPVRHFAMEKWELKPFGRYIRPIPVFSGKYQRAMKTLFENEGPPRLDFGIGYHWRTGQSALLLATRK